MLSSNSHLQQSSNTSPRLQAGTKRAGALDRADSPYGHHRQTSIVHGYQHSRNGSVASTSSSPLSPQIIAAAGGLGSGGLEGDSNMAENNSTFSASTATLVPDRSSPATENNAQKRVERMHSGKSRRDHSRHNSRSHSHSHSHSHSRHHHKEEHKTVGEYALHVLFTSVSRPRLPKKLLLMKEHSLLRKPRKRLANASLYLSTQNHRLIKSAELVLTQTLTS